jgi:glutathione S-transferase
MKLYQFSYSPFAAKVRKCLELKGLAFEIVEVPYMDRRELVALTGGSILVPVLADGPTVVSNSPRITAYLDERYPPSLRPGPLGGPVTVFEQWADEILEDVAFKIAAPTQEQTMAARNGGRQDAAAMYRFVKERKFGVGCIDAWRAGEAQLIEKLSALLAPLAVTVAEQPYFFGERPTVADAAVYGIFYMLDSVLPGRLASLAPGLVDWYRRVHQARG